MIIKFNLKLLDLEELHQFFIVSANEKGAQNKTENLTLELPL